MDKNNAPKIAFFYMLSLVALVFMSIATGAIIFQIINKFVPDILNEYSGTFDQGALKFGISALVVAAPIFYFTMRLIQKSLRTGALHKDSAIRRWLTYFILFISSVVIIGWLIAIIVNFLDGELTLKFFLQAATALLIAASIFSFYLYDIKREIVEGKNDNYIEVFFYSSLVVVVAVFISALFLVESPKETRDKKFDSLILREWDEINMAINNYYSKNQALPESLDDLLTDYNYITKDDLVNNELNKEYGYNKLKEDKYELCSIFKTSNIDNEDSRYRWIEEQWPHEEGEQCIGKVIDERNPKEYID